MRTEALCLDDSVDSAEAIAGFLHNQAKVLATILRVQQTCCGTGSTGRYEA
jgi:hypothetical protein